MFSDMKCKIFDFLRSMLHNIYRFVDFMFAELTTMTHYFEFGECWKDIYDPIICLRSLFNVHGSPIFELSLLLHKSCRLNWLQIEVFNVATFVFGLAKQGRKGGGYGHI